MSAQKNLRNFSKSFTILGLMATFLTACPKHKKPTIPSYGEAKKRVLAGGSLVEDPIEKRMNITGGKQEAIKKGSAAPFTGIVINNSKAEELIAIKTERKKLRKLLESARLQMGTMKIIYDATIERLKYEAKRSWWERNRGVVGLVIGVVLGVGTTVGLVYALTRGNALSTNTSALKFNSAFRSKKKAPKSYRPRRPFLIRFGF